MLYLLAYCRSKSLSYFNVFLVNAALINLVSNNRKALIKPTVH